MGNKNVNWNFQVYRQDWPRPCPSLYTKYYRILDIIVTLTVHALRANNTSLNIQSETMHFTIKAANDIKQLQRCLEYNDTWSNWNNTELIFCYCICLTCDSGVIKHVVACLDAAVSQILLAPS